MTSECVERPWLHASARRRGVYEAVGFEARVLEKMWLMLVG